LVDIIGEVWYSSTQRKYFAGRTAVFPSMVVLWMPDQASHPSRQSQRSVTGNSFLSLPALVGPIIAEFGRHAAGLAGAALLSMERSLSPCTSRRWSRGRPQIVTAPITCYADSTSNLVGSPDPLIVTVVKVNTPSGIALRPAATFWGLPQMGAQLLRPRQLMYSER
jgi:hypothetical protein